MNVLVEYWMEKEAAVGTATGALIGALRRTGAGESRGKSIMRGARTGAMTDLGGLAGALATEKGLKLVRGSGNEGLQVVGEVGAIPILLSGTAQGAVMGHRAGKRLSAAGRHADAEKHLSELARKAKEEADRKAKDLQKKRAIGAGAAGLAGAGAYGLISSRASGKDSRKKK